MQKAIIVDKINVGAYFAWSLLDNFEWDSGYRVRFGLIYVDFKNNLDRHMKMSAHWYSDFITNHNNMVHKNKLLDDFAQL